jgi:hypothetical protein
MRICAIYIYALYIYVYTYMLYTYLLVFKSRIPVSDNGLQGPKQVAFIDDIIKRLI